jgi:hypothetical protein
MDSFKDSVAFWASVLGTLLGLLGAIQSLTWLAAIGGLMLAGSIGAVAYAARQHELVESAALKVAGRSLDSLNMATLRRRLNRSLIIQEAQNEAIIDGEDLTITWKCIGYCRTDRETSIEFSIDTDSNIPFDALNCFAYDLMHDPNETHRIRPILIGPDGISKKIAIPFLAPLTAGQPFNILLNCELPGCIKPGIDYYTASLSFDQERVQHFSVRLMFLRDRPNWLRVYEPGTAGAATLLKDLRPAKEDAEVTEYLDTGDNAPPNLIRIYVFSRFATPLDALASSNLYDGVR